MTPDKGNAMHITDISIKRSALHARSWKLHIEMNGLSYDGWFDDFGGLLTAIQDAATFFAYRAGKMSLKDAALISRMNNKTER